MGKSRSQPDCKLVRPLPPRTLGLLALRAHTLSDAVMAIANVLLEDASDVDRVRFGCALDVMAESIGRLGYDIDDAAQKSKAVAQ